MKIDFATGLTHRCTSRHPFYRHVYEHPPDGVEFRLDESPPALVDREYARDFCASCPVRGPALDSFVGLKNSLPPSDRPVLVPTYPEYLGPRQQWVWVEDWATLLSPWVLNGKTKGFDVEASPHVRVLRHLASRPEFVGVVTHMRSTERDVRRLLRSDKVPFVPLGLPMPEVRRQRSESVRFLFTNSWGGQSVNFRLRGGVEVVAAFRELVDLDVQLTLLGSRDLPRDFEQFLSDHPKVYMLETATDDQLDALYRTHDVFLIPGCRLHSVAVARALAWGMPVVCSDGWGYREHAGEGAMFCEGQWGLTSGADADGFMWEDYGAMPPINGKLVEGLVEGMRRLVEERGLLEDASLLAREWAEREFRLVRRNELLKEVLT